MKCNERDGSLTLYIQHEALEGGKGAKWISAPAGPLFMAGRFYGPKDSLIDGSYKIPECKRNRWLPPVPDKGGTQ